jgi:hypothetical protein
MGRTGRVSEASRIAGTSGDDVRHFATGKAWVLALKVRFIICPTGIPIAEYFLESEDA